MLVTLLYSTSISYCYSKVDPESIKLLSFNIILINNLIDSFERHQYHIVTLDWIDKSSDYSFMMTN